MNFSRFRAATHISKVKCAEMAGDRPNNLRMKFSPLNVDFSSISADLTFKEVCARGCQKGVLPKSGYFAAIGLLIVKTVADTHIHVFITTSLITLNPQNRGF